MCVPVEGKRYVIKQAGAYIRAEFEYKGVTYALHDGLWYEMCEVDNLYHRIYVLEENIEEVERTTGFYMGFTGPDSVDKVVSYTSHSCFDHETPWPMDYGKTYCSHKDCGRKMKGW